MTDHHLPRPRTPRLAPLALDEWSDEARAALKLDRPGADGERIVPSVLNIFATLARHPALLRRWLVFGNHILGKSTLDPRDREVLILRIAWRTAALYEWGQHAAIGRDTGLSDAEIEAITVGPDDGGWSEADRLLLRAADELWDDACLTDATWTALAERLTTEQLMDLVFTCGQYVTVAMALNSFGVQREPGVAGWPAGAP